MRTSGMRTSAMSGLGGYEEYDNDNDECDTGECVLPGCAGVQFLQSLQVSEVECGCACARVQVL